MRSVVVARYVPWPANSGDKQRTLAVVRALSKVGDVTLCAFAGPDEDPEGLRRLGCEVRTVPMRRGLMQMAGGLVRGRSLTAARFWNSQLARKVDEATGSDCDVLVLEHVQSTMYAPHGYARCRVIDMHNIESALAERVARSHRGISRWIWMLEAALLRRVERRLTATDLVAVVSDVDREVLTGVSGRADAVVAPNGWDEVEPLKPPTGLPTVSFVALMSWGPNVAAAQWFAREVWPLVVADVPQARLQLVGRNPADEVRALTDDPSVLVTGTVPDVEQYYRQSTLCVAPLLAGGGSRLKILESLACGRPCVATTIGVEGLEDLIGRGVVVADDPVEMAAEITRLLGEPEVASRLGMDGARAVAESHTWVTVLAPLMDAIAGSSTDKNTSREQGA